VGEADPHHRPQGRVSKSEFPHTVILSEAKDLRHQVLRYAQDDSKNPLYALKRAIAFSSNFRPRPGAVGSTSMPFSIFGVSS
jgi:hypothetical protein